MHHFHPVSARALWVISLLFSLFGSKLQAQMLGNGGQNTIQKLRISLPITWEDSANIDYSTVDFGGAQSQLVSDPLSPANLVLKITKPADALIWAGTTLGTVAGFANPIPFTNQTAIKVQILAPRVGMKMILKAERSDNGVAVETSSMTRVANAWHTVTFYFDQPIPGTAPFNPDGGYNKLSLFPNFGVDGATAGEKVFYVGDVEMGAGPPFNKTKINLPITWDDTAQIDYATLDFAGNLSEPAEDPQQAGNLVLKIFRTQASLEYAGTVLCTDYGLLQPIPFAQGQTKMSVRVWCPQAGTRVRLKAENKAGGGINVETDQYSTLDGGWEYLVFDFSQAATGTPAIDLSKTYDKLVIFFSFGTTGGSIGNQTYYVDNVTFGDVTSVKENTSVRLPRLLADPGAQTFRLENVSTREGVFAVDGLGRKIPCSVHGNDVFSLPTAPAGVYQIRWENSSVDLAPLRWIKF